MNSGPASILVIGYGNPGRRDDGLGPAAAAALAREDLAGVTVDSGYQLAVEDAAAVAGHDAVVFIDAACRGPEPFSFGRLEPGHTGSFSTHSVRPEAVLGLARDLFGASTPGYVLGIRGYEFDEFGEELSDRAQANLAAALEFIVPILRRHTFCGDVAPAAGSPGGATPATGDI